MSIGLSHRPPMWSSGSCQNKHLHNQHHGSHRHRGRYSLNGRSHGHWFCLWEQTNQRSRTECSSSRFRFRPDIRFGHGPRRYHGGFCLHALKPSSTHQAGICKRLSSLKSLPGDIRTPFDSLHASYESLHSVAERRSLLHSVTRNV